MKKAEKKGEVKVTDKKREEKSVEMVNVEKLKDKIKQQFDTAFQKGNQ